MIPRTQARWCANCDHIVAQPVCQCGSTHTYPLTRWLKGHDPEVRSKDKLLMAELTARSLVHKVHLDGQSAERRM